MAKTPKSATEAPRAKKAAGAAKKPARAPAPVQGPVEGGVLKPALLLERVAARAGVDKKRAKLLMEAVLTELGESVRRGESFILPALGKGKVTLKGDDEKGRVTQIKLRPVGAGGGKAKKEGETPLAPAEE